MSELTYQEMQHVLMDELRLMHYPVAVKYIFKDEDLAAFEEKCPEFYKPVKKMTFCQWEIAARMKGQTVLADRDGLGCSNAEFVFGWKPLDENEIKSHAKYTRNLEQAERFVKTKPRLPEGALKAVAVSPLADAVLPPDSVHFYCDNMQAYHLVVDYMAALDVHPLRTNITMNSSACAGNVFSYLERQANLCTACSSPETRSATWSHACWSARSCTAPAPSPGRETTSPEPTCARTAPSSYSRRSPSRPQVQGEQE
jgi:uncharacterized protein (DUF169 family)